MKDNQPIQAAHIIFGFVPLSDVPFVAEHNVYSAMIILYYLLLSRTQTNTKF